MINKNIPLPIFIDADGFIEVKDYNFEQKTELSQIGIIGDCSHIKIVFDDDSYQRFDIYYHCPNTHSEYSAFCELDELSKCEAYSEFKIINEKIKLYVNVILKLQLKNSSEL